MDLLVNLLVLRNGMETESVLHSRLASPEMDALQRNRLFRCGVCMGS